MDIGHKISTLIKATLRRGLSPSRKERKDTSGDPKKQLEALRRDLARVEAKERQIAELLKAAQAKAQTAMENDDREEVMAQNRLAIELETHLQNESTQAVTLTEKLKKLEEKLTAQEEADRQGKASTEEVTAQTAAVGGDRQSKSATTISSSSSEKTSSSDDDSELTARKSRLSG
jgi:Fic family protein